ncbi:BcpO-related WXXGXW repeat protein [Duganella sp. CY15W]|uniref:YXWGXW repeat-containing protein n=1 Tax=Duganella sp. CY15W TaxID=2692172 RepID=UPI001370D67F|nr:YXWGXW repeat-containing protein [Duganella sp. CY15W]MYM31211.1 BcpO-related WXXGXW repeat protein [Duganella sp. CY15W]
MIKPIVAGAMLALSAAAFVPTIASAQVGVSVVIGNAPPPLRFESVPAPRRGYIWAPGYWNWDGHRHVWSGGRWEPERIGSTWRSAEWVRDGGGWRLVPAGWTVIDAGPGRVDYISVAPPPPRYEVIPAPRPGYIWSPGYWEWRTNRHVWIGGNWIASRPGYFYTQPRWVEREGHWFRQEARWDRGPNGDRDHDGIPNRYDHHDNRGDRRGYGDRDHDGVPNRYDRDRDGDGVPNRYDRHPDNRRRD